MIKTKSTYLALLAVLLSPMAANAGIILYSPNGGLTQVNAFEPLGQSFVAEDASVMAGLYFDCINCGFPNDSDILYQLYEGLGIDGSLLSSVQFSLASGFSDFYLVDFTSVSLLVGSTYSLVASAVGTSPYWGVGKTSDPAAPQSIFRGTISDGRFALNVIPVGVPEPGTLALLGLGLVGMAARRRKV